MASVGLAVALVSVVSTARDGGREAALQAEHLRATATVIASLGAEATAAKDRARAFASVRAIANVPDVSYARIETLDGSLLAEAGQGVRLTRDTDLTDRVSIPLFEMLRSRTVAITVPVIHGRKQVGRVVMLGRSSGVGSRLGGSLLTGLLAAIVASGLALLLASRLQRGISGPILALTQAMATVRADHDYRLKSDISTNDEVGDLAAGFNAMLSEIRTRDDALARHLAGLEQTVAERTSDLSAAKDAADAANSAKSDFLATMSHEIRTPMNGIMVMAEMLAAGEIPPRQRRFAEVIAKSGSSLLAIINDILDFSKIEAGKMDLEAVSLDPSEVADDVCSLFWERARSKGLDLAAYVDPAVPRLISADAVRLRQVVGNLINNAIKFTETGAVFVEMVAPAPDRLRVAVHDTGIGIPKDKLGSLFSAFSQADQSTTRRFGGTGLGLAICKRLVEAMGGQVMVKSVVGQGSVFAFEIPVTVLEPAAPVARFNGRVSLDLAEPATRSAMRRYLSKAGLAPAVEGETAALTICGPGEVPPVRTGPVICVGEYGDAAPAQLVRSGRADAVLVQPFRKRDLDALLKAWADGAPLGEAIAEGQEAEQASLPTFAGARVLVADDSAVNREVAIEALSRLGITASVACDGRQAVDAVAAETFDLVLMDGSMPEMDGYDASRAIRAWEAQAGHDRMPIVALTAHVVGAVAEAWRAADMDAVLHKPFTLASLAKALGAFLTPSAATLAAPVAAAVTVSTDLLDERVQGELAGMAAAGRGDFVSRIRTLYRDNAPRAASQVAEALTEGDLTAVASAAHSLKSMSLNIGARAVAELCAEIEGRAREGVVAPTAGDLSALLTRTLSVLDSGAVTPAASADADPDLALVEDLKLAAQLGQFRMVYQRQMSRDGVSVAGVEALLRWRHPEHGEISPAHFIPLAEQHGLMRPITRWVLGQAMAETADLDGLSVGINASALEFGDASFVDEIAELIASSGFPQNRLEIEITETAILNDGEEVRRSIVRLHEMGVKIALDDFGVGYSSLSHLRMFPFDKLKIDRSFITDVTGGVAAATLVHAVVSVGRALGMKVVAEGVETEEQRNFLKVAGVHSMQGYLFGKPEPIESLRSYLREARAA